MGAISRERVGLQVVVTRPKTTDQRKNRMRCIIAAQRDLPTRRCVEVVRVVSGIKDHKNLVLEMNWSRIPV